MIQVSDVTGKTYDDEEVVFFANYVQSAHYVAWGAKLIDVFVNSQTKFVYVFSKEDHEKYKHRWIKNSNDYRANKESGGQGG